MIIRTIKRFGRWVNSFELSREEEFEICEDVLAKYQSRRNIHFDEPLMDEGEEIDD